MPIQPFAVLEGTRGYPPPEKRFSRKSLGVSTVCSRTPRQPLLIGQPGVDPQFPHAVTATFVVAEVCRLRRPAA